MFITLQVIDQEKPVILNTNKICSITHKQGDVISILFDNQVEMELPLAKEKDFTTLLMHLSITNKT